MTQLFPDAPAGLGRMMAGGAGKVARRPRDYYPTEEPETLTALLQAEAADLVRLAGDGPVWEPCAGKGDLVRVLESAGFTVTASDIEPQAAGISRSDVLLAPVPDGCRAVITNPPFALAIAIAQHLLGQGVAYLALLLKAQWWHPADRDALWARHRPAVVYALTWRPDFTGARNPTMDCIWVVWRDAPVADTLYRRLAFPGSPGQEALL